jgi:transposase
MMLQITPQQRFFLGVEPIDFRRGIDGITAICKNQLQADPMCGAWFAFSNKRRTAVKLLVYDGQGYWLCMKRFSQGKLAWWPKSAHASEIISAQNLQILLYQGDPTKSSIPLDWKPV